ncbi:MAG: AMP-binding protein [Bacteroidales bacterium]|nr:AMP-binding protein [Bacteroidales bacterium]
MQNGFNNLLEQSIKEHWSMPALTDFKGATHLYKDVARKIEKIHLIFEAAGINKDDKIALCGRNNANWAISFFAIVSYGAIAVPILHDFKPDNIHHIIKHSDAKLLFAGSNVWENLNESLMQNLNAVLSLEDFELFLSRSEKINYTREHLNELFGKKFPNRFTESDVNYFKDKEEKLTLINYTSGSTGFSKGVMLSNKNIWSNIQFCLDHLNFLLPGDKTISMLPMAHMYGLAVEVIHPFCKGCHIHFLTRTPSPKIIMDAFSQIQPKLIVAVPLIIEKIIKTKVFPLLDKPLVKLMLHVPFVDQQLFGKIKAKLQDTFGGNLHEMIIGGAAINKDVEQFLRKIDFPYTVGYGMTECAPLISYEECKKSKLYSCGKAVERMQIKIDSKDPQNIAGEIYVKGDNVMLGYYKNEEATNLVIKEDGWMNTGDMGVIDENGYLYIKGRSKNMILGPSGQNIYPEEIEDQLNNMPYVAEAIIVEQGGKLVALVYPDFENADKEGIPHETISLKMDENRALLNHQLPSYSQISQIKIRYEEFEKTPKRSIKRYLYQ